MIPNITIAILSSLYSRNHEIRGAATMSDDPVITVPIEDEHISKMRIKRPIGGRMISAGNAR